MNESVGEGKTIKEAENAALKMLGCSLEDVNCEILQQPAKGIFGITKMAKVRLVRKEQSNCKPCMDPDDQRAFGLVQEIGPRPPKMRPSTHDLDQGQAFLEKILLLMGISGATVNVYEDSEAMVFDIQSEAEGLLIGRHGQTLAALQYLINRILKTSETEGIRYIVDVGGYRGRHKLILEKMAIRVAQRVAQTKKEEQLDAMSAFDRRIIHLAVKDYKDIVTHSTGEGAFRRVVISPASGTIDQ